MIKDQCRQLIKAQSDLDPEHKVLSTDEVQPSLPSCLALFQGPSRSPALPQVKLPMVLSWWQDKQLSPGAVSQCDLLKASTMVTQFLVVDEGKTFSKEGDSGVLRQGSQRSSRFMLMCQVENNTGTDITVL